MSVWGVSMVRDEADVIEGVVRHMAAEVDQLLVADNGSVDGTREILDRLAGELALTVVDDPDPAYYQSRKMTALADQAYELGATWIVPFDADELWLAPHRIRDVLREQEDATVVPATLFNHFRTAVDSADSDPFRSMAWRQAEPAPLPKVAVRWEPGVVIHQGNHGASHPLYLPGRSDLLQVRHFPARSAEQWTRKGINGAQAYRAAADLPVDQGAHWRSYGLLVDEHGPAILAEVFREHWWYLSPTDAGLVYDPAAYRRWEQ